MEIYDAILLWLSGVAVGIFIAHKTVRKWELKMEYEKGKCDGINEMWPHLTSAWVENIILTSSVARNETARSNDSTGQAVH